MPAEPVDMTPDMMPLLSFSGLASNSESREGAEGDQVVGEERARACEIHCLDADLECPKPAADQGNIIILFSHDSLQGPRLGDRWCACVSRGSSHPQTSGSPPNGLADEQP